MRFVGGTTTRVHFAAYRLKYSRWMYVELVPNQQVEPLVRSLVNAFHASQGVPLSVVFDRPKTVLIKETKELVDDGAGGTTTRRVREYNATLAQCAVDFSFALDLAAPRSGNQKGLVENLVKFVKRNFFTGRTFVDAADLEQQLTEWLVTVNTERPCDATGVIPAARLAAEQARMRALRCAPREYGLKSPTFVKATGLVEWQKIRYAMPPEACGVPATIIVYPDRVRIFTAHKRHDVWHPRFPVEGRVSYLTGQRAAQLAAVHGARKRTYYMRERLLELGEVGAAFMTELIHRRTHTWWGEVERLFTLLETIGEPRFRALLKRALFQDLIGAQHVEHLARAEGLALTAPPAARVGEGQP